MSIGYGTCKIQELTYNLQIKIKQEAKYETFQQTNGTVKSYRFFNRAQFFRIYFNYKKKKNFMTKPAALKRGRLLCTKPTKPLFTKNLSLFFSRKKRKKRKSP